MAKAIIDGITINKWVVDCPHTGNTGGGGIELVDGTKFGHSNWVEFPTEYLPYLQTQTDWGRMFYSCTKITTLDLSTINTKEVTKMEYLFAECINLTSLNVSSFNTSNVVDMSYMFRYCQKLTTIDLSNFNTSKVTTMYYMFDNCSKLTSIDLSNFNTSSVHNMSYMFNGCNSLISLDVSNLDTSNVTNIGSMLGCSKLTKVIGEIDCSKIASVYDFNPFGYSTNSNLRKVTFKNIGSKSGLTETSGTERATNWGVNSDAVPDARQSLIDSLITYSYDRATAGFKTCTFKLSTNTKAVLTTDEIAQITAKGYTIA